MRKVWDIHGGVHPPENKIQSTQQAIGDIPLPEELIIPLNQHIGAPAEAIVEVGQRVLKGQIIAEAQGYVSAAIHASTSGTVSAIEERAIPHPSGMHALCVVIKPDGEETWAELKPIADYKTANKDDVISHIRNAGIAGMGGAGFPTAVKLKPRGDHKIDTLILNGTECEPYITADDVLMREKADEIVAGAEILAHLLGQPETVLIGIEDNKPEAIAAMQKATENKAIEVVSFPTKYPSGGEKQLIEILTGKQVPKGKIPADIGIVLQNVGTVQAVYRAIEFGEPLISRVTTVVGESLGIQRNINVLIGTPISHVLAQHLFSAEQCARLIIGGPMMGYAMEHTFAPVIKTTNCLLVPSLEEMPAPEAQQACIRCGMCAEACPASLLPQQLFWFSQSEDFDRLQSHNLFDCIECGACSFVCPSNIPLVQYYRASKGAIRHHDSEKQKAEHSRKRFEFRQERLDKAEAEKEAKRQARKKAAEQAKLKVAENAAKASSTSEAKETTTSKKTDSAEDPAKARGKLERSVSSIQSRVDRAQTQLSTAQEEGAEAARIESLQARLKGAEQKLSEAKLKLSEFDQSQSEAPSPQEPNLTSASTDAEQTIKAKLTISPQDKIEKSIATLEKRIATAKQKAEEAEQAQSPTADALRQGVAKLESKLETAQKELAELQIQPSQQNEAIVESKEMSAADAAIEKAKARAAELASMSADEKAKAQVESLKKRLAKAQARLEKAESENDDNIDAFRLGVEKLQEKLAKID